MAMNIGTEAAPTITRHQRARRLVRQVHRWLGLLIAIQVFFWVAGGLVMSALQLDAVRGEHVMAKRVPVALAPHVRHVSVEEILRSHGATGVGSVTLTMLLDQPVYRLESPAGTKLLDAATGQPLSPISEATARALALADYAGPGAIAAVTWVEVEALEYRGRDLPLWSVRFDDERDTTLYISPDTGQVVARRNDLWRAFDFVWMLHIMDYEGREDFNHPLLIVTAATALLFVITGLFMLGFSFRIRSRTS
jgi:uncharacterized iron-regulated membrane protein